uniref:Uncharacterized protein n=1 Tax=Anguilla anguilla TaxID=7936 RepID=A0A0E9W3Z9_ANGAN
MQDMLSVVSLEECVFHMSIQFIPCSALQYTDKVFNLISQASFCACRSWLS